MSHTTKLTGLQIRDEAALVKAAADLKAEGINCHIDRNAVPNMYYANQHGECDYVLRLPNAQYGGMSYDVGFDKQDDGTYAPVFDEWMNVVAGQIGAGAACPMPNTPEGRAQHQIGRFMQHYAANAAINAAATAGMSVEQSYTDQDGNIQLVLAA